MSRLYPAIPEPAADMAALLNTVRALKMQVEMLTGQRGPTSTTGAQLHANRVYIQSSTPTAQNAGDLWVNTGNNNELFAWSGADWIPVN